jgi:hypothetical protein
MLAQRYPELYDGILALAPAINWASFIVAEYWPQQVMNRLGIYPRQCEFDAFTTAAIKACDQLDGVVDGVISNEMACEFDPRSLIGSSYDCDGIVQNFSKEAADIVHAIWTGPIDLKGHKEWYGLNFASPLDGLANTTSLANGTTVGVPFSISTDWITYFVAMDPYFDPSNMTMESYFRLFQQSRNVYGSIIDTSDPDLSAFGASRGKAITWHGTADQLIFTNGSREYYQRVFEQDPDARDYYRFFEAPGVQHCGGGRGLQPVGELEALMAWVERGQAPETLSTINSTALGSTNNASRNICAWPKAQTYVKGDPTAASSFACL